MDLPSSEPDLPEVRSAGERLDGKQRKYATQAKCRHIAFRLLDGLFLLFIVAPLQVGVWRGFWHLTDALLFPEDELKSAIICFVGGYASCFLLILFCHELQAYSNRLPYSVFLVVSRLYTLVNTALSIWEWRGTWMIADSLLGCTWDSYAWSSLLGFGMLFPLKLVGSIACPPYWLEFDERKRFFSGADASYDGKEWMGKKSWSHVRDRFLVVFVLLQPSLLVWRGIWGLQDEFLLGEDPVATAWASLLLGLPSTAVCLAFQEHVQRWTGKTTGIKRLAIEDTYSAICGISCIGVWRGYWMLFDACVFPGDFLLSNATTCAFGMFGMMVLFLGNTVACRGLTKDGETIGGFALKNAYLQPMLENIRKYASSVPEAKAVGSQRTTPMEKVIGHPQTIDVV